MTAVHHQASVELGGESIVPRAPVSLSRPVGFLDAIGRKLVLSALSRVRLGRVVLVEGERVHESGTGAGAPACTVRVLDRRFYSAAAFGGTIGIAESYMDGLWETDDLPGLIETLTANYAAMTGLEVALETLHAPLDRIRAFFQRNTVSGARRNIRAHYDLSNDFFGLFLDPTMTYSCAVFERDGMTLEEAQRAKIDMACRKLRLGPEDHLLEIGTGWGAMAIHAASVYGCRVTTTTISERQHEVARERIRSAGLEGRITLLKEDYRALKGAYDKLVSIEMIEAVGRENFDTYFATCSRLLKPDGAGLIQAIVIRDQFFESAARSNDFLKKYIFPGSCLASVRGMLESVSRRTDLRTWHLEDFAPHYVMTLAKWREAFMSRLDSVRAMGFDDRFVRMWEYYLAYCEGAFRARHVGVVQLLLTKPRYRGPMTGAGPR